MEVRGEKQPIEELEGRKLERARSKGSDSEGPDGRSGSRSLAPSEKAG